MSSELNDWIINKKNPQGSDFRETGCQWAAGNSVLPVTNSTAYWNPILGGGMKSGIMVADTHVNHVPAGIYVVEFDYFNTNDTLNYAWFTGGDSELLFGQNYPNTPQLNNIYGFIHPHRAFNVVRLNVPQAIALRYDGMGSNPTFGTYNVLMYKVAEVDGSREPLKPFGDYKYQFEGYKDNTMIRGSSVDSPTLGSLHPLNFDSGWGAFLKSPTVTASTHPDNPLGRGDAPTGIYHCATYSCWGMDNFNLRGFYTDSRLIDNLETIESTTPQDYLSTNFPPNTRGTLTHLIRRFGSNVNPEQYTYPTNNIYEGEWSNPITGSHPTFEGYRIRLSASDLGSNTSLMTYIYTPHQTNYPSILQQISFGSSGSLFGGVFALNGGKGFIRLINEGNSLISGTGVVEFAIGGQTLGFFGRGVMSMVFVTDGNTTNSGLSVLCHGSGNLIGLDFEIVYL